MKIIVNVDMMGFAMLTSEGMPCDVVGLMEAPDGSFMLGLNQNQAQQEHTAKRRAEMEGLMDGGAPKKPDIQVAQPGQLLCGKCKRPLMQHAVPCK